MCLLKYFCIPFFCRCKVSAPAKTCFYSFCCDVGWLEWIPLHLVWGQRWLRHRTWLATFTTSLPCGDGVVWSWCSWWVNVKSWCSWCYNKFLYIVGAVIRALLHNFIHCWSTLLCFVRTLRHTLLEQLFVRLYTILYIVGMQFYILLGHNFIHCWSSCLYIFTQLCTLLEHNSIHYWSIF